MLWLLVSTNNDQRISAFSTYKNDSITRTFIQAPANRTGVVPESAQTEANDITWRLTEPNDIPWTDRELLEERERSFVTQKAGVDMSYGAEYLDYSYEDDDCDGVTLSPSASDVSSLSTPSCLQSIDASSVASDSFQTSDEDTGATSEKQSTTLGPSEASSSQTSEAATPLILSMSLRFGIATSSDTTGTTSFNGAHFSKLLETLPPPIDCEENDEDSEESSFKPSCKNDDYGTNSKQFEEHLNISHGPHWKNDFFAVDSVKSHPTEKEVSGWAEFHAEYTGESHIGEADTDENIETPIQKPPVNSIQNKVAVSNYPTQQQRSINDLTIGRKSTSVSTSSSKSPQKDKAKPLSTDPQNEAPIPTLKRAGGAYRRFDLQRVKAFQRARRGGRPAS